MTYNVFGGTLSLTQSINSGVSKRLLRCWSGALLNGLEDVYKCYSHLN